MAIGIQLLHKFPMRDINPHALGAGVLSSILVFGMFGVLFFGNPHAGEIERILAIPAILQTAPPSSSLRADSSPANAPDTYVVANGHTPPSLGIADPHTSPDNKQNIALRTARSTNPEALIVVPIKALTAPGPGGLLPVIAPDGRRPADVYARPFMLPANKPAIALVVGGLGLKKSTTLAAINDLPPQVTLSFVPYTRDLQSWIDKARDAGHEVMLELPMEPFDYPQNDPGPQTLLATVSAAENTRRLEWLLSRATGYFAVTNYMGSKFTASEIALAPVMRQLRQRGLDFIYDGETRRSSLRTVAEAEHLSWIVADRIIDTEPSAAAIDEQLLHLEALAIQKGTALGTGFSWPVTTQRLKAWTKTLAAKGYVLVPASAVLRIRTGSANVEAPPAHNPQMVAQSGH